MDPTRIPRGVSHSESLAAAGEPWRSPYGDWTAKVFHRERLGNAPSMAFEYFFLNIFYVYGIYNIL